MTTGYEVFKASDVPPDVKSNGRVSWYLVNPSRCGVNAFALNLHVTQPRGMGPAHVHEDASETFLFIEGRAKMTIGDEEFVCGPDTVAHVRSGVSHGFDNVGESELKFITIFDPPLPMHR